MVKDLIIFLFTLPYMDFMLFVPALTIAFFAGLITLFQGVRRWT